MLVTKRALACGWTLWHGWPYPQVTSDSGLLVPLGGLRGGESVTSARTKSTGGFVRPCQSFPEAGTSYTRMSDRRWV